MTMRDLSKTITAGSVWMTSEYARRVPVVDHGACACGRLIVSRYGYKECGPDKHSRRRCTNHKLHLVRRTTGQW
jgi:hypothetical protein